MRVDKRFSPDESNKMIFDIIESNKNFQITRIGLGGETAVSAITLSGGQLNEQVLSWFFTNAGFYGSNDYLTYSKLYKNACDNSDIHAYWNYPGFIQMEDFLVPESKPLIDPSALESFRFESPWTKALAGKKVLIISPFKDTIDNQLLVKDLIWKNKDILPDADYITYKSVQSIGGKGPHYSWYESFNIMCNDISNIDFDIALLGCGSYGLPLSDFIKSKLNKSSIYIGGGLQLYFGIMGKRWDSSSDITRSYNEYWTRPSQEETPQLNKMVEGGCYW